MQPSKRQSIAALLLVLCSATFAAAQISIGFGSPGVSVGINISSYPNMVRVPDYPVYYAPQLNGNYFFFDGLYWVYQGDDWYASAWYNGPWDAVGRASVPLYVLRIPVRYYRQPPAYFRGWQREAPPRWGEHWGRDWERGRSGWNHWDRRHTPSPAPLPRYQSHYSGERYPDHDQRRSLHNNQYRYQSRDTNVRDVTRQQQSAPNHPGSRNDERRGEARGQHDGNPPPRESPRNDGERKPDRADRGQDRNKGEPPRGNDRANDRGNERGGERDKDQDKDRGKEGERGKPK